MRKLKLFYARQQRFNRKNTEIQNKSLVQIHIQQVHKGNKSIQFSKVAGSF